MLELRHLNALDDCDFDNPLGAPWEESRARGRSPGRAPIRSCADSYSASGAGASPPARHQATKSQSKSRRHVRLTSMILTFREYPARIRVFQMLRNEQDAQGGRQSGRRAVSSLARPLVRRAVSVPNRSPAVLHQSSFFQGDELSPSFSSTVCAVARHFFSSSPGHGFRGVVAVARELRCVTSTKTPNGHQISLAGTTNSPTHPIPGAQEHQVPSSLSSLPPSPLLLLATLTLAAPQA